MRHILTLAKEGGKTGAECRRSGPYRCSGTVKVVVFIRQGERFPAGVNGAATEWILLHSRDDNGDDAR